MPPPDYKKLSDSDLEALAHKDYSKMSDAGLQLIAGSTASTPARGAGPDSGGGTQTTTPAPAITGMANLPPDSTAGYTGKEFLTGLGSAFTGPAQGIKQLAGGNVSDEEIEAERAKTSNPAGWLGNMAGNVVAGGPLFGLARSALLKAGAKVLPSVFQKALTTASVPLLAGAEGAVVNPVKEDESRLDNAMLSAGTAGALQATGAGLRRAATGLVKPNEDALNFLNPKNPNEKIVPTMAQGGSGFFGKTLGMLENTLGSLPFGIDTAVRRGQVRAQQEAMDIAGHRVAPQTAIDIPPRIGDFPEEIQKQYKAGYDAVYGNKRIPMTNVWKQSAIDAGAKMLRGTPDEVKLEAAFRKRMADLFPVGGRPVPGNDWKDYQAAIRKEQRDYANQITDTVQNKAMSAAFKKVDEFMIGQRNRVLSGTEQQVADNLDNKYIEWLVLKDAINSPVPKGGARETSLDALVKSVEKNTPEEIHLKGEGAFQDLTGPANRILTAPPVKDAAARRAGYLASSAAVGLPAAAAIAMSSPLPLIGLGGLVVGGHLGARALTNRGVDRFLYGDFAKQKRAAELLRKINPAIAGAVGGSTEER